MFDWLLAVVGLASLTLAACYAVLALVAVLVWRLQRPPPRLPSMPPVTVLKPLCGAEPGLYQHLRSFCQQNYPRFQIVFGVRELTDPALASVRRLMTEFPSLAIDIVVNPELHGINRKISNLINMIAVARYDILVIADSDTFVGPDYLRTVTAPLLDQKVGLVTCIYRDMPTPQLWSRIGAMYINEWYMPSVLLARLFGFGGYASGQTLCLRRETLEAIGGLGSLANQLADDYRMGEVIRGLGLKIVLSPLLVMAEHHEPHLHALTRHELRWMRTIRVLRPRSFRMIFLSFSLPLAIFGVALTLVQPQLSTVAWVLFQTAIIARLGLYFAHRLPGNRPILSDLWLLPFRDLLILWVWVRTFSTSRVTWRGDEFDVDADGVMHRPS